MTTGPVQHSLGSERPVNDRLAAIGGANAQGSSGVRWSFRCRDGGRPKNYDRMSAEIR